MCILFLVWIFVQAMLIKTTLKQDQKEEGRSKDKKIIVQGNLNSSFAFLFERAFQFCSSSNFPVARLIHASIFPKIFPKYFNHKYLIVIRNIHKFKVFGGLWKKIMFGIMKKIWGVTKKIAWNIVFFCKMTTFTRILKFQPGWSG